MSKTSENIVSERVSHVARLLIDGNYREDIIQFSSAKWKIGERQTDKYIARAKILVEKSVKRKVEFDYAKAVRRYEELYKLSKNKKDYKTALSINKELTNLQGLFKIEMQHSGDIKFICSVPD